MKREDMDNDDIRKLKEKREKRDARAAKRLAREERRQPMIEKNYVAVVGFILACAGMVLSYTGFFIWISLIGLILCVMGFWKNRPMNYKKYLAGIGLVIAIIAMINAVRVSNTWVMEDSAYTSVYEAEDEVAAEE